MLLQGEPLWHPDMLLAQAVYPSPLPEIILSVRGWQDSAQICSLGALVPGCGWQGWVIPSTVPATRVGVPQGGLAES